MLTAGDRLGPYEIPARIGAGGMGAVYKARDNRLDRIVAIKVSEERFSARFDGEARAVAALNHPNICQLYDVGPNYLVLDSFSKDGSQLYAIFQDTTAQDTEHASAVQWQLFTVDVKSGAEKSLSAIDLPVSVDNLAGFSIHPDGKRFLTSVAVWPFDIWMIEGFNQPQPKNWLERLLRH
jgi:serine/threonine protein kinase